MTKVLAFVGGLMLFTTVPAFAQEAPNFAPVVKQCQEVALAELQSDYANSPLRGQCIAATGAYLTTIVAAGLTPEVLDQTISDFVVSLSEILFTPECVPESEVAQAISLASQRTVDDEQSAQIRLIYQTLNACDFVVAASILTTRQNGLSLSSASVGGTKASQN